MVWNRFLKSHWLTVMLQASPEQKEKYDWAGERRERERARGKGVVLRDETSCSARNRNGNPPIRTL